MKTRGVQESLFVDKSRIKSDTDETKRDLNGKREVKAKEKYYGQESLITNVQYILIYCTANYD